MLVNELAEKNLRMSGRTPNQERTIHIEHFDNLIVVRSGITPSDSCVYLAYSKSATQPYPEKPSEGIFQITFERGKKNDLLLNLMHNVYIKSKCISTADLCLKFNQEAFLINVEICPIQSNGDLARLCVAGINRIIEILKVKTYFTPTLYQFACVSGCVLLDPDHVENENSEWRMSVAMRSTREILYVEETGIVQPNCVLQVVSKAMEVHLHNSCCYVTK